MNLKSKVAVVTGASSGIGTSMAKMLVADGAVVYGLARSKDKLKALAEEIGDQFIPVECDVRSPEVVRNAFKSISQSADSIDILINNAGLGKFGAIESMSVDDFDVQSETNIRGIFLCSKQVIPHMRKQNDANGFGGHIVNIASVAGLVANATLGVYNATKFAVRGLSESMMKELRYDGIKVSCVYPGSIRTKFFDTAEVELQGHPMEADSVAETVLHLIKTPQNYLISEVVMRPLRPRP